MSYASALDRLYALGQELHTVPGKPRRKFELAHMRTLMAALGNPERSFTSVLVAGTNGKGSTSSTLASILGRAGYRTGLYTSPHLSRVNERIQVNGSAIEDDDFAALFSHVEEIASTLVRDGRLPAAPSFFETVTAMAFLHFAARRDSHGCGGGRHGRPAGRHEYCRAGGVGDYGYLARSHGVARFNGGPDCAGESRHPAPRGRHGHAAAAP